MAKGGYFIIAYPEDLKRSGLTMDKLVSDIQKLGGEVAYILHDKDIKKPHYHILCAWAKSVPKWEAFVEWMKNHECSAPDLDHKGKTRDENKYCSRTAIVRDIDQCLEYMLHE